MTTKQIEWARKHDWYVGHTGATVHVNEIYTGEGSRTLSFDSFVELREWAGY